MSTYNWQQPDWPHFRYDLSNIYEILFSTAEKMGSISGKLSHLAKSLQTETIINLIVEEAVKTSEIEGERINPLDVRSSIKNQLGLNPQVIRVNDKRARGIAELILKLKHKLIFFKKISISKNFQRYFKRTTIKSGKTYVGSWNKRECSSNCVSFTTSSRGQAAGRRAEA